MKILQLIAFAFAGLMIGQNTRFIYHVDMKTDSLNPDFVQSETANLDVSLQGSVFYSAVIPKRDSTMARMRQTRSFDFSQMQNLRSVISYTIKKDYAQQNITFENRIGRDLYAYTETQPFQWKILSETQKIGDYETQKAETEYGGRTWEVWFTTEIPFQDGPYKFSGLPGLIVKAEDTKGDYSFQLVETKKIDQPYTLQSFGQPVNVKKDKYEKTEARFRKDPIAFMRASMTGRGFGGGNRGGGQGGFRTVSGNRGGGNFNFQDMQKRMVDEINRNNNPIELK